MGCESCAYKVCKRLDKIDIQPCDLLVVGDIPQPREVVHNQVMQGPGRKILDQAFASVGLVGKKIHYVTAVQCAIPKGKNIKKDIVNCHETLLEIIKACNPKAVLLLGKVAYQVFEGAKVTAKVQAQGKDKKILVFKYKAKSNYRKRQGHRQPFTKVVIEKIEA